MPFNVTDNDIDDGAPDYSPAGTKIAYSAFDGNDYEIYTIEATGGTPFQVTDNDTYDQTPSYSPNGKKIAYSGSSITEPTGTGYESYTINVGGGVSPESPTIIRQTLFLPGGVARSGSPPPDPKQWGSRGRKPGAFGLRVLFLLAFLALSLSGPFSSHPWSPECVEG